VIRRAVLALGCLGGYGLASASAQIPQPSLSAAAMVVASDPWFAGGGLALTLPEANRVWGRFRSAGIYRKPPFSYRG
jgi:hypothetical protein